MEKSRNLEIPFRGQSRSLKLVPFDELDMVCLLAFYSKFVPKRLRRIIFEIFNFKSAVILNTRLGVRQGH